MNFILSALILALPCAADVFPIEPVRAVLRAEPDRLVVDLRSDSIYWIEEIAGLHPMPSTDWPEAARAATERHVNEHFRVSVDGARVPGRLVFARYRQLPLQVTEQGLFILRMQYPAPAASATLAIEADFFEEFRREKLTEGGGLLPPFYKGKFITKLSLPGGRAAELSHDSPPLALAAADARRGKAGRSLDALRAGAAAVAESASSWPALLALALCLGPGALRGRLLAGWAAAIFAGALAPAPAAAWLPWAAGLAVTAAAWPRLVPAAAAVLSTAALAALGHAWAGYARPWLPRAAPGSAELALGALGALAGAAAVLAALWPCVRAARRSLNAISESRADELYARRLGLAATALLVVCGYGLWQTLSR